MAVDLDYERQLHQAMQPAPPGSLFETFADKVLRRVEDVILGRECKWPLSQHQIDLLVFLRRHQGRGRAVPLLALVERMSIAPRIIRDIVRELRLDFGVLICNSRDGEGYWIAATQAEVKESMQPYFAQTISELRVYRAMTRTCESIDETLSQIRLALDGEETHV